MDLLKESLNPVELPKKPSSHSENDVVRSLFQPHHSPRFFFIALVSRIIIVGWMMETLKQRFVLVGRVTARGGEKYALPLVSFEAFLKINFIRQIKDLEHSLMSPNQTTRRKKNDQGSLPLLNATVCFIVL